MRRLVIANVAGEVVLVSRKRGIVEKIAPDPWLSTHVIRTAVLWREENDAVNTILRKINLLFYLLSLSPSLSLIPFLRLYLTSIEGALDNILGFAFSQG